MSLDRRISELEALAMRQGFDALSARLRERVAALTPAELAALQAALEAYCRDGTQTPGLLETIQELTEP